MKTVTIYTDGACKGNPGPGGFGSVILVMDKNGELHKTEISKGFRRTTNNRMEIMAVIHGLEKLDTPSIVDVYSDSQYVVKAFNQGWIESWKRKNWIRKDGPVKNVDLWQRLLKSMEYHDVRFHWVKGHANNEFNNRCDELASKAATFNYYEELDLVI